MQKKLSKNIIGQKYNHCENLNRNTNTKINKKSQYDKNQNINFGETKTLNNIEDPNKNIIENAKSKERSEDDSINQNKRIELGKQEKMKNPFNDFRDFHDSHNKKKPILSDRFDNRSSINVKAKLMKLEQDKKKFDSQQKSLEEKYDEIIKKQEQMANSFRKLESSKNPKIQQISQIAPKLLNSINSLNLANSVNFLKSQKVLSQYFHFDNWNALMDSRVSNMTKISGSFLKNPNKRKSKSKTKTKTKTKNFDVPDSKNRQSSPCYENSKEIKDLQIVDVKQNSLNVQDIKGSKCSTKNSTSKSPLTTIRIITSKNIMNVSPENVNQMKLLINYPNNMNNNNQKANKVWQRSKSPLLKENDILKEKTSFRQKQVSFIHSKVIPHELNSTLRIQTNRLKNAKLSNIKKQIQKDILYTNKNKWIKSTFYEDYFPNIYETETKKHREYRYSFRPNKNSVSHFMKRSKSPYLYKKKEKVLKKQSNRTLKNLLIRLNNKGKIVLNSKEIVNINSKLTIWNKTCRMLDYNSSDLFQSQYEETNNEILSSEMDADYDLPHFNSEKNEKFSLNIQPKGEEDDQIEV